MQINNCHIISEPAQTLEGWSTTVSREGVTKGPFDTIAEAVACAKTWETTSAETDSQDKDDPSISPPPSSVEKSPDHPLPHNSGSVSDKADASEIPTTPISVMS